MASTSATVFGAVVKFSNPVAVTSTLKAQEKPGQLRRIKEYGNDKLVFNPHATHVGILRELDVVDIDRVAMRGKEKLVEVDSANRCTRA